MKRRRNEISLFEILRQPPAPAEPRGEAEEPAPKSRTSRSEKRAAASAGTAEAAPSRGGVDPALGSTTPSPDVEPRPRIDVTPPSRATQAAARRRLPDLPEELTSAPVETDSPPTGGGPRWWEQDVTVRPPVLAIAAVGVIISWIILYQLGASGAGGDEARRDMFAGADAPGWDMPVLHGPERRQPEIRNALDPDGRPAERLPAPGGGSALLPVVMVAQPPREEGREHEVDALMKYIDSYTEPGFAQATILKKNWAIYVGPFESDDEAKEALRAVGKIPTYRGTKFHEAYIHQLEFTAEERARLLRP